MSCTHENTVVLDSSVTEVSIHGSELLLELIKCEACGETWIQPYLALVPLNPMDEMLIINEKDMLPSLEYIENVLSIKRKNIPQELIETISAYPNEVRRVE